MGCYKGVSQIENKFELRESSKTMKGKFDKCQMITIESLDLRDDEVERNPKLIESKIEEVRLFDEFDS